MELRVGRTYKRMIDDEQILSIKILKLDSHTVTFNATGIGVKSPEEPRKMALSTLVGWLERMPSA